MWSNVHVSTSEAPGWDGIETEHFMHARPILKIQRCILFNVMMHYSVVPQAYNNGNNIPILKDKRGNATDINNYRAINLSPIVYENYLDK